MFEKNTLHVRLKNASVELVLSWLDKWYDNGEYNLDEEDENILLDRNEPLLDAALAEYTSENEILSRIYVRGDISLKKACLKNRKSNPLLGSDEWPNTGTFHSLLNNADIENGMLECLVTNPSFNLEIARDVIDRENDISGLDDKLWRRVISLLSRNSQIRSVSLFDENYDAQYLKERMWQLSETLPVEQENADFLYNLFNSIGPVESDDVKRKGTALYESDKGNTREFVVARAIKRWEYFTPREEDKVRQGFFQIKGHSGNDICLELLKNLQSDTVFFDTLQNHDVASYREYFYRNVNVLDFDDYETQFLDKWFEKDGENFLDAVCKNHSIVGDYDTYRWLQSKIKQTSCLELRNILDQELSHTRGIETNLPEHLKHDFNLSSVDAMDTKRVDRLERQVDLLFKDLLGDQDINPELSYSNQKSSLFVIGEYLAAVKQVSGHLQKKVAVIKKLVVFSLILNTLVLFVLLL
jgi:hypothetical protein